MLDQAKSMQALKIISPVILPLLRLVGVDVRPTEQALKSFEELQQTVEEMAGIPDRFNELFGERGWIMYDQMNLDVAKAAIAKAEAGDLDGAEVDLVNHYDAATVEWQLLTGLTGTLIGRLMDARDECPNGRTFFETTKAAMEGGCVGLDRS